MKRGALAFYHFWYKFIFGDDSSIAITVAWTLLATYALIDVYYNGWYVTPVVVGFLLVRSLQTQLPPASNKKIRRSLTFTPTLLLLLMVLIVVLPYDVTYSLRNGANLLFVNMLFPSLVLVNAILIVTLLLALVAKTRPTLLALCGCLAALLLIQRGIPHALQFASDIALRREKLVWSIVLGIVSLACLYLLWRSRWRTTTR